MDLSGLNTFRDTKTEFLSSKRYEEHPILGICESSAHPTPHPKKESGKKCA